MSKKFFSAYEAAEYAATITDEWESESGALLKPDDLLGMMSVADEEATVDEENTDSYYVVTEEGALGATNDDGKMIVWFATPTKAPKAADETSVPRFCAQCGAPLAEGGKFCSGCGAPVTVPKAAPKAAPAKTAKAKAPKEERPHGAVGYSSVISDPRFLQAVKKNRRSNFGCAWIFILLPLVAMTLHCLITKELEVVYGMFLGGVVSAVFLIFYILSSLKDKLQKPWEGVVESKQEKTVRQYNKKSEHEDYRDVPYGIVVVRDTRGKKRKIQERLDTGFATSYTYLKVGDRVKFHAGMGLHYPYEKYDKSKDEYVICAICGHRAPIADDDCPRCHNPLLK